MNNDVIDNKQYMFVIDDKWKSLKQKLIERGYKNELGKERPIVIVVDNEHKWFYPVPGIFMYWKYSLNRKYPLRQLSSKDILDNFEKLIVEKDNDFYNKLLRDKKIEGLL